MAGPMAKRGEEGVVLIVTLGFLIAMMIIVGYTATRALAHGNQMQQSSEFDQAFLALDGAHRRVQAVAAGSGDDTIGLGLPDDYAWFDSSGGTPTLNLPDPTGADGDVEWQPLGFSPNGNEVSWVALAVQDDAHPSGDDFTTYYMAARVVDADGNVVAYRAAEDVGTAGENVNVWTNAIFGGVGQSGALINGNVSIHGSVHLLGNDPNAVVVTALDMSGTSFIHNSYGQIDDNNGGIPSDLATRIGYTGDPFTSHPSFNFVDFDGDGSATEFTLDADLRIKNGTVDLGGNSEIGTASGGSNEKTTMDGVYIGDGGGDEVISGAEKIFSDNGYESAYDIDFELEFPTYAKDGDEVFVAEKYLEGFNATTWTDTDGTDYANPNPGSNRVFVGDIVLEAGSQGGSTANNFYWNASLPASDMPDGGVVGTPPQEGSTMPTADEMRAKLGSDEFFIWYDSAENLLLVNGRVPVDGNVTFESGNGQNDTFDYEGKGTIAAIDMDSSGDGGNHNIDANLLTTDYPQSNLLGLMSQHDMLVGGNSQLSIMGGFYAQGEIVTDMQTNVVGALVGNYFNLGNQVPNIYWVPGLPDAWTDEQRMIGSDPIQFPARIGWREYNVRLNAND